MTKMVFDGWKEGFLKVSSTKLFQEHFELGLKQTKEKTDDLLEGNAFVISVENLKDPQSALSAFLQIGALCHLE
ncbi:hypothetical protein BH09BAC4_BH09BAC4_00590 [soil metagenome]